MVFKPRVRIGGEAFCCHKQGAAGRKFGLGNAGIKTPNKKKSGAKPDLKGEVLL